MLFETTCPVKSTSIAELMATILGLRLILTYRWQSQYPETKADYHLHIYITYPYQQQTRSPSYKALTLRELSITSLSNKSTIPSLHISVWTHKCWWLLRHFKPHRYSSYTHLYRWSIIYKLSYILTDKHLFLTCLSTISTCNRLLTVIYHVCKPRTVTIPSPWVLGIFFIDLSYDILALATADLVISTETPKNNIHVGSGGDTCTIATSNGRLFY